MSIACRLRRPARLCAIACALLVPATGGAALAAANPLAQDRNYWSYAYENPDSSPAQAQERYYSSYGDPEPVTSPQSSAPSNEAPWLPIALSIAGALAIVAASTTQLRRARIRRRRAARTPA
jgi:hypothetical protein